jgi:proline iminopeptidase
MLRVSRRHELYFEECGNPAGKPVLVIHGGPGAGCSAEQRRYFDPARYRIILFDQRGCGRSRPHASLEENTTWHLVADIEALRERLSLEAWMLFGGSWGATLALAYAQSNPDRVTDMVLRALFAATRREREWYFGGGAAAIFPEAWERFMAPIPPDERADLLGAYHRRLTDGDPARQRLAALAWCEWEACTSTLLPDERLVAAFANERFALALARIECHYFVNDAFLGTGQSVLARLDSIRSIPTVIVQGRYDMVCPAETAWRLHRLWPEADFKLVSAAGHSFSEPAIRDQLIRATDRLAAAARPRHGHDHRSR